MSFKNWELVWSMEHVLYSFSRDVCKRSQLDTLKKIYGSYGNRWRICDLVPWNCSDWDSGVSGTQKLFTGFHRLMLSLNTCAMFWVSLMFLWRSSHYCSDDALSLFRRFYGLLKVFHFSIKYEMFHLQMFRRNKTDTNESAIVETHEEYGRVIGGQIICIWR